MMPACLTRAATLLGAAAAALLLALAPPAGAQPADQPPGTLPGALRGAWFAGECADPRGMLVITTRSLARVEAEAPARLFRVATTRDAEGWTIGTATGPDAPRIMLRPAGEGLETAEPDPKLRDDRLPGATPIAAWRRCPAPPPVLAALHGEGAAFLGMLEHLEVGCATGTPGVCAQAIIAQGDVSGDGVLTVAELSRLARGAAWLAAVQEGGTQDVIAAAVGAGAVAGILAARGLMESLDYDGDGRLAAAELAQDRAGFATIPGTAEGRPLRVEGLTEGAGMLRGLFEGLMNLR
jgi:hypothetical protein